MNDLESDSSQFLPPTQSVDGKTDFKVSRESTGVNGSEVFAFENFSISDWESLLDAFSSSATDETHHEQPQTSKHPREDDGIVTYYDNEEEVDGKIKSRRDGSLGRIIASTAAASSPSSSGKSTAVHDHARDMTESIVFRQGILEQVIKAFNSSSMDELAKLVQHHFCETCFLVTPDLTEPIFGRAEVMMLFSLTLEKYPDGIYRTIPGQTSVVLGDTVTTTYVFVGTRVFHQSIDILYAQVKEHWQSVQHSPQIDAEALLDTLNHCWVPEAPHSPSNQQPSTAGTVRASLEAPGATVFEHSRPAGVVDSAMLTTTDSDEKDEISIPRSPGCSISSSLSREAQEFMSSLGHTSSGLMSAGVTQQKMTVRKRRMDFVFDRTDHVTRIVIVPVR